MGPLKPLLDNIHAYVVSVYPDPSSVKGYLHTGDCLRDQIFCCKGRIDTPRVALQSAVLAQSSSVFELSIKKHSADGQSKHSSSNQ